MKNRRAFLATVASGLSLAALEPAAAAPTPSPAPSATDKPVTAASAAIAATMRRFDPALSDGDMQAIAKGIDANNDAAKALHPQKKRLKNGDAPVVRFAVSGNEP